MTNKWHLHALDRCLLEARMSKDPRTQVGAVIVGPDQEVRSTGFNGFPRGMNDTPERLADQAFCDKCMVHAERNAILNAARIGVSTRGCILYLACTDDSGAIWGGPPCTACTIEVIQAGIKEVVSYPFKTVSRWLKDVEFAKQVLVEVGVRYSEVPLPFAGEDRSQRMVPRTNLTLNVCECEGLLQSLPDFDRRTKGRHHSLYCPMYRGSNS